MSRLLRQIQSLHARAPGRVTALAAALLLLAANPACLGYPPYWDGLVAVFHQAAWLHHHHFDFGGLVHDVPGYMAGGPRVYLTSILPPLIALLAHLVPGPAALLAVCHLLTLAAAGGIIGVWHVLLRERAPPFLVRPATALLLVNPFFMAQAWSLNLEIALMLPSVLALRAFSRDRPGATLGWLMLAWAVKVTALMHGFALAAGALWMARRNPRQFLWAALYLLPCALFLAASAWENAHALQPIVERWILPERLRLGWSWTLPWYLAYERTPDLLVLGTWSALAALAGMFLTRTRAAEPADRAPDAALLAVVAVSFAGWFGLNLVLLIPLPRYLFATLPFALLGIVLLLGRGDGRLTRGILIAWLLPALLWCLFIPGMLFPLLALTAAGVLLSFAQAPRYATALLWVLVAVSLFNHRGALPRLVASLPEHQANNGHILERSREFTDDLELQRRVARRLEEAYADKVVTTSWPLLHAVSDPFFGYVNKPLAAAASHRPGLVAWGVRTLDAHVAAAAGTAKPGDYVAVWTDNVFSQPPPPFSEDRVLERIRYRDREAVLFLLPGAPRP